MVEYSACAPHLWYVSVNCRFHDTPNTLGASLIIIFLFLEKKRIMDLSLQIIKTLVMGSMR